jgi:hypothetical protein
VHLLVLETADKMWLDQESAGGQTNVEKCTSVHQRVQGFKAEQMSAPVGPRDCRQDVVGPRECRWSDQAEKCTCVHQSVAMCYHWMRRVQVIRVEHRSAPVGTRDCRKDVVGPRECRRSDQCGEVHVCAPESGSRLLDEESAGVQSRENECTCRSQRQQKRCGRTKRVQVVGPSGEVHLCARETRE